MYKDTQGVEYPCVHLFTEEREGYLPGWYFHDETEGLYGPFGSLEETLSLLNRYIQSLNGKPIEADHGKRSQVLNRFRWFKSQWPDP